MKKLLSLITVLALVLCMVPAVSAESTVLCDKTGMAKPEGTDPDQFYVTHTFEITTPGILTVDVAGNPNALYNIQGPNDDAPSFLQLSGTQELTAIGTYTVGACVADAGFTPIDGEVSLKLTFEASDVGGETGKAEYAEDYSITLETGRYELVLDENAIWTCYNFIPAEIGKYTISVEAPAQVGLAGYYWVNGAPAEPAQSFAWECQDMGQGIYVGVTSENPAAVLTIEKTGESGGIVETVYEDYINVHTPSAALAGTPEGVTLTKVDIQQAQNVVKDADGFYHLDSVDGPMLYVDLYNNEFDLSETLSGAFTVRGSLGEKNYNFITSSNDLLEGADPIAMQLYNSALSGSDGIYPMTQDIEVFIKAYGNGQGWFNPVYSCFADIQAGDFNSDSAWLVMCYSGEAASVDPGEDPTEELVWLYDGENPITLVPGINYTLKIDLGTLMEAAGTLAWTGDVLVTVNGTPITSPWDLANYSPRVMVTATVTQETAANFTVTLPGQEASSGLALGNNSINVADGYNGDAYAFTADEAGTYVLSAAEGEENAYIMVLDAYGSESVDLPYEFSLEAGQTISFAIATGSGDPDLIDLVLTKGEGGSEPAVEYPNIAVGDTTLTLVPGTNYNLILGFVDNMNGVLSWNNENVTVMVDGIAATSPATISSYSFWMTVVATVNAETEVTFTLTEDVPPAAPQLVLGANAIDVTDTWNGTVVEFTAEADGDYILNAAEGETNYDLYIETAYGSEWIETLPYTFSLKAGESQSFIVLTANWEADTIDLVLSKAGCAHTPDAMEPVMEAVAAGDHTVGVKALYLCPDCSGVFDAEGNAIDLSKPDTYAILPAHLATMEEVDEVKPTTEKEGMKAHMYCTACDKYFAVDEKAENVTDLIKEVTKASLIIPKLGNDATGDIFNMAAVVALVVLSAMGITTVTVLKKKKLL